MPEGSQGLRRGSPVSFWGSLAAGVFVPTAVAVVAGDVSRAVQVGRDTNMFTFFVSSSDTATFQLQAAHVGAYSSQGTIPDASAEPFIWHDLWYLGTSGAGNSTQVLIGGTGAFAIASLVPDFEVNWVRLKRTDAGTSVNVVAGHEAWGD